MQLAQASVSVSEEKRLNKVYKIGARMATRQKGPESGCGTGLHVIYEPAKKPARGAAY